MRKDKFKTQMVVNKITGFQRHSSGNLKDIFYLNKYFDGTLKIVIKVKNVKLAHSSDIY